MSQTTLLEKFISKADLNQAAPDWLSNARAEGINLFNTLGIPTLKNEDWKYTNLRALTSKQFSLEQSDKQIDTALLGNAISNTRLVFVDGIFNISLSKLDSVEQGVEIQSIQNALASNSEQFKAAFNAQKIDKNNAFAALNMGLFTDGAFIQVSDKCTQAIELVFINQGQQTLSMPRSVISIASNASANIIERQISDDDSSCLSNSSMHITLADNAQLDYCLIQLQGKKASHIGGVTITQAQNSQLNMCTITLGGQMIRNELHVSLDGECADANCSGLYYGKRRQHIDNHTTIHHTAPACTSRELYKGILDDRARGVFHGRIKVDKLAQLTASTQENNNLLLSRDAEVDTKPQLEIYADDVKCAHGATVGELDIKQLFYLQTRGINLAAAKTLLTFAFAAQVVEEIKETSLREALTDQIANRMKLEEMPR